MPTLRSNKPTIAVTIGDPSGIGPEVTVKALASSRMRELADFLIIGDSGVLDRVSEDLGLAYELPILNVPNVRAGSFSYGKSNREFGRASVEYLDKALWLYEKGAIDCVVTAPVNKASIRASGLKDFEGHTEYFAAKTNSKDVAMMFVGKDMKITLVTRHIALGDVPDAISVKSVYRAIAITHKYLRKYFNINSPRIGVAGLNPHAGERGLFGKEDMGKIAPAIKKASKGMKNVYGPFPPDVVFHDAIKGRFDAVIAMYHDQGLIPFKLMYFETGVNMTLGLPFIRTSPDHGTAFDIAGKGRADPRSMQEAILLACRLATKKRISSR